jgi:hypothetical protein
MELSENENILSFEELWAIVNEYVNHLHSHNQTDKLEVLYDSLDRHKEYYELGLQPMLDFMSRHGMPEQFPMDGSHFNETTSFRCGPRITSPSDAKIIRTSEYW